jgi:UDP-glucose:(heptosyl)LPS alpha-1,3-glucosyltransferase
MKFAFVVNRWFAFGGMQRTLLRMARACVELGHEVHIYTGAWDGDRPRGIEVIELDTRAPSNHASNWRLAGAFAQATEHQGYACRVGFTKLPGLDLYYAADPCFAARLADRPFFYAWLPRYRALLAQEAAVFGPQAHTQIMLIAHAERERFMAFHGTQPERFHLLPPGIDVKRLAASVPEARMRLRAELGLDDSHICLLAVGSGFRTKGIDRLIRALASLPDDWRSRCRLFLAGEGKSKAYLALAQRLGVAHLTGFLGNRADVADLYRAADGLVHAPRTENTGTVLLEAMVAGLPLLCTANCGFAHHVTDAGAGLVLAEPFDQQALNQGLLDFITSDQHPAWGEAGPAYARRHDLEGLIEAGARLIIACGERTFSCHS